MKELIVHSPGPLRGTVSVPGDKSISHRALILSALAQGTTKIRGLLKAEDVSRTREVLQALGTDIRDEGDLTVVTGRGGVFEEPKDVLYCGNSGTTMRLMMGVLAGQDFTARLTGDASLNRRPMKRVTDPLTRMGTSFCESNDKKWGRVIEVRGSRGLAAISYELPVASAQVKSAVMLAGLFAKGISKITESRRSRNHTELMAHEWGGNIGIEGGKTITVQRSTLRAPAAPFHVPGDFSSAAFFIAAGLLVPDSEITIQGVGLNETRTALLEVLTAMGGSIIVRSLSGDAGERYGNLLVKSGSLITPPAGQTIEGKVLPRMIDEIPILGVLAAFSTGAMRVSEAEELRVKESDRIETLAQELKKMGAKVMTYPDGFDVEGGSPLHPAVFDSHGDHRIAMAMAVAGMALQGGPSTIRNTDCIATSFPKFVETFQQLGATIEEKNSV